MDPPILKILEEEEDDDQDQAICSAADVDALNTDIQEACILLGNQQLLAEGRNNKQPMTSRMSSQPVLSSELSRQEATSMGGATQQAKKLANLMRQVSFSSLFPVICSLLDSDREMQLQTLYQKFQSKEFTLAQFVPRMRSIVDDQIITKAGLKLQQQYTRDAAAHHHIQAPSNGPAESSGSTLNNNPLQQYEVGGQGDSHSMQATQMSSSYFSVLSQDREHPTYPVQGFNEQQQQQLHLPQASSPTYGSTDNNRHPFPARNATTSAPSLKQAYNSQMRQLPVNHNVSGHQPGTPSQGLSSFSTVHAEGGSNSPGNPNNDALESQPSKLSFSASTRDYKIAVPSAPSAIAAANSARTPVKKTSVGQKKPLEALGSSPSPSSKKQKVSGGAFLDQSIEHLNDVTAVGGVNLREEEEQLFSGPKEGVQVSEATRRVLQEEEDRLILQKIPLQKKLAQILAKSGLKSIGSDVEKCLSLCFEERMRVLMSSLIRLSKQRVDIEKLRHRTFITKDVRKMIMAINQKVIMEWEKKRTEEETVEISNELQGSTSLDGDKENDGSHARPVKIVANEDEDENRLTTAANVAARAAVGLDDMMLKWQLMAEQARQKLEGETYGLSGSQAGKDMSRKNSKVGKSGRDQHEAGKRGKSSSTPGSIPKLGRNQVIMKHNRVARSISVKDVVAVLEREVQMSKSTLMSRLYSEIHSESSAD